MGHMLIHRAIESRLREVFALSAADVEPILAPFAAHHRHCVNGHHALSGVRSCRAETRAWYERLARLMPDIAFTVHRVAAWGPPHAARARVEWECRATVAGEAVRNAGAHDFLFSGGRVRALDITCDDRAMADALARLGRDGAGEALARPIGLPLA